MRSFLVRKKLKQSFRELFDRDKTKVLGGERTVEAIRRLCFFYDAAHDSERLVSTTLAVA